MIAVDRLQDIPLSIQLAANGNTNQTAGGFPVVRWAQTANYGYVPNDRLQNVFMAVAMDLGDPQSPFGSVHPRDKQDVGDRLVRSGRAVVYKDDSVYYQGPLAQTAQLRYVLFSNNQICNCRLIELDTR